VCMLITVSECYYPLSMCLLVSSVFDLQRLFLGGEGGGGGCFCVFATYIAVSVLIARFYDHTLLFWKEQFTNWSV
jgi:hypothetical protein